MMNPDACQNFSRIILGAFERSRAIPCTAGERKEVPKTRATYEGHRCHKSTPSTAESRVFAHQNGHGYLRVCPNKFVVIQRSLC